MILPGVRKKLLSNLSKEDASLVLKHVELVKSVIKKKKGIADGTIPELLDVGRPKDELNKLMKAIKDVEKNADSSILSVLLDLEINVKELLSSIDEEYSKLIKIESGNKPNFNTDQKNIQDELVIGLLIEHQLNILYKIQTLCRKGLKEIKKLNEKNKNEVGSVIETLDNIASHLKSLIFVEEVPNLSVTYNLLRLEGWPEIEKRIQSINLKFEGLDQANIDVI